jgi:hypothetical protein
MKVFYKSIFFIRSCENCLKFDKDTIKEFKTIYNNIKSIQKQPHTDLEDHQDLYNKYSMTLKEPVTHDDMTAIIATLTKLLIEKTKDEYLFIINTDYFKINMYVYRISRGHISYTGLNKNKIKEHQKELEEIFNRKNIIEQYLMSYNIYNIP